MKKLLILSLMLSICAYANTQPFSRAYMMNMLFEAYSFAYYDTPRQVEDLLRFIDLNEETRQVYAWEYDYLKINEKDLVISSEGSNVVLKTTDGRKIFYGDIYMPYSRGDGMKRRINLFDKNGYYFQSDSLDAAFREARIEVVKKYHPDWEPAPEEFWMNKWRLAVFKVTPDGLKPMFQEDSIDTTTDYYRDLERMALKFLSDHSLGAIIFDSRVFQRQEKDAEPHNAQFSHGVIRVNQEINYHIADHLGSVRAVIDGNRAVSERNDYYAFGAKHVRPDYPQTINRFNFNGKEAQDDLGLSFLDYGARMYDSELGRWFNQDPLAEKYYPFSGYHFSGNNPLVFVDKDGRFYDGYQLDKNGYIKRISNEGGDKYDVLYPPDKRNNLKLDDTSILKNLSSVGRDNASFTWGSPSELASLFLFASDFSSVEWRFSRFDIGNGDQYALGTIHHPSLSIHTKQMGFSPFDEIALIHSHPTAWKSAMEEYKSMGWSPVPKAVADFMYGGQSWVNLSGDPQNVSEDHNRYKSYNNYYTYFPRNGNIYRVRGVEYPAYIKNISKHNNNPKSLFWGILNGK